MEILTRYSGLKTRSREIRIHTRTIANRSPELDAKGVPMPDAEAELAKRCGAKLDSCANYLVFNDYYTIDQQKLVKAHTCKQHLLCPFCAARRSAKQMALYVEKIKHVVEEKPHLKAIMMTLTVKNGHDLTERFNHLKKAVQRLSERRRDYLKKGRGRTEWRKLEGALYSFEFTYSEEHGWHPHVHMVALANDWIDREALSKEWLEVTGDSYIVDVRRIKSRTTNTPDSDLMSGLAEVLKYSLKFSDLEDALVWKAYTELRGKRLMGSLGALRGVPAPESLLDDPLEGLPYIELFYRYKPQSGMYDLVKSTPVPAGDSLEPAAPADRGSAGMEDPNPPEETPVKGEAVAQQRCEAPLTGVSLGGLSDLMPPDPPT